MRTDRIYIARDGKSGMHVLVRILAVGDIGADYLPIDPDGFNELTMARDARSLVLAAQGLGPMLASEGDLASRIFVPSELRRGIAGEMDLVPSDLGGLLSECYFDPYAEPVGTGGMGYRGIGRTGKKAARDLIEGFDFSNAGDLSYLDSQFRAVTDPPHSSTIFDGLAPLLVRAARHSRTPNRTDSVQLFVRTPHLPRMQRRDVQLWLSLRNLLDCSAVPSNYLVDTQ